MAEPIRNITVVGGGSSGWLAACYLARAFGQQIQSGALGLTLIESPRIGIIGVGESTARPVTNVLRTIGINERDFIKRTNATFKLSGYFENWSHNDRGEGVSWVNPFYSQPDIFGVNPGYAFATYGMEENGGPKEMDFAETVSVCPALVRARKGPRLIGDDDFQARVPYSYHTNATELAKMLMERGKELGVKQILDDVENVELDERGYVAALSLAEHGRHPVEFVIDATGFASIIIGKALGEPFEPYDKFLLNDRALVAPMDHKDPTKIDPMTKAIAMDAGWAFRVPLFNRMGSGYIFSSKFISDEEAAKEFLAKFGEPMAGVEPKVIRMRIGKTRRSWVKNCVALGLSSGFVEPLEATAIFSVQLALRWLRNYFPDSDFNESVINKYNRLIDNLYEEFIEYIALNFYLSNREDTPYWRAVSNEMEIPDSLAENLELWRHTMPDEGDLLNEVFFKPSSYRAALMGKHYYKGRDYPQAASISPQQWQAHLRQHRQLTDQYLKTLPDHYELLRHIRGEAA